MKKRLLAVLCVVVNLTAFAHNISPVQDGVLDLRNHNWKKDGIVNVSGNWEFYWDKFYDPSSFNDSSLVQQRNYALVPAFWNKYITTKETDGNGFGFATYHVKILCPSSPEALALKLFTVQGAYILFVNGQKAFEMGKPGTTEATTRARLKPAIVKVQPVNNMLDIVVQVSNFDDKRGGLWDIVKIGTQDQIMADTIRYLSVDFIIAGVFLLAFTYNLVLFFYFRKRYALLYFSLLCLIICIRIVVTDEIPINYIFNLNWLLVRRVEFISLYFSVPIMSLFSYYLFPKDFSKKALYIILPMGGLFILAGVFSSYYTYTYLVTYYQLYMMATALYGLYVYIRAMIKKRIGSYLFFAAFTVLLISIVNDILYVNLITDTVPLYYAGLAIFAVILSIISSRQFAEIFFVLEITNKQLADANKTLGVMNEDIQQKNTELKKINNELDSFVNRTSHDLRAPLSSVTGVTNLMENETNISTLHDYALLQKRTLQRMDDLINDIIDFSKNKRLNLSLQEVNFSAIVTDALEDHKHAKNAADIDIVVEIQQDETFVSDVRRVSTIINNLVSNAIKYADLSKLKPCISVIINVINNMANIEVFDNGIGIEENKLGKIFTMFYRATSSATGSGLGLYIIKETVDKLDGSIFINSRIGEGTSVKIELPDKSSELHQKQAAMNMH